MDKKELQKKLNKPYTTENWKEVVQFVFPNVSLLNPPSIIPIDNDKIETFKQIGNVRLQDGKNLALFELKLKANVNIIRNRVELNNLVSQYIDQNQNHGVLSIFEQGNDDYRFTFSARSSEYDDDEGDFKTTKTDTKRFTYVLGKNESCKTPAQRFFDLSEHKDRADIKAIEDAFSVDKLSKLFFKEYKDQYTAFVNYMMQTPGIFKAIYSEDDKAIRDFVKILLGRIIFIKFVQKKGWMGVDASSKKWIDGDYRFLENGFANFKHQDLFYSSFLEPLFEALDQANRPNDIFTVTNTRVPYLSGGLFELEDKKTKNINFPANYFEGLFEFLDRYNFTIDENDTNDHEVGIDPEMLGHIFENLLEDNKDKGAFYTPKEIVRYMCQESLKEYLKTSLENNKQWPSDATEAKDFEQALHNFVTKKEAGGIIEFEETIARALKEVKICDPAIGSGAFPMGLLNEIFQLVHKLHEANRDKVERIWELKGWQPNLVKQNIIQNSIYGVDIEKGAVDVARLRFWLSLIVDEPEPKALPHLDYKIVVGNSLVSKLGETIIDIDWDNKDEQTDLFGNANKEKQKQLLNKISEKQNEVFNPDSDEEKLSLEIRNLKIDLLINQLELMVNTKGLLIKPNPNEKKIKEQTTLWLQTRGWKDEISQLEKLKKQHEKELHFFDWKLDFPEIMNEQVADKVGFDIVIGNPPYIGEKGNEIIFQDVQKTKLGKNYYTRWMDYFYFFFHQGINITKNQGTINYITTNYFFTSTGGQNLRFDLKKRTNVLNLINFNEFKIFESATGQHNAITLLKKSDIKYHICDSINVTNKVITNSYNLKSILERSEKNVSRQKVSQEQLFEGVDNQIRIEGKGELNHSSVNISNILQKMNVDSQQLGVLTKITMGIVSLSDTLSDKHIKNFNFKGNKGDGIYVLNKKEIEELKLSDEDKTKFIKPFFKNSDIKKYFSKEKNDLSLIYLKDEGKPIILPNGLKKHFEKYKDIIVGLKDNFLKNEIAASVVKKWYANGNYFVLFTPKKESYFSGEKIIAPYRSKSNDFAYNDKRFYASKDVAFILPINKIVNLKSLVCILNSKLVYKWLYLKGKRKGQTLELYANPLSSIPIKNSYNSNILENLHKQIIELKTKKLETSHLEQQIDNLVYKLYELSYDEVLVVEPEFSERMSREEYEELKLE